MSNDGFWVCVCNGCGSVETKGSMSRCSMSSQMGMKRNQKTNKRELVKYFEYWHPEGTVLAMDEEAVV